MRRLHDLPAPADYLRARRDGVMMREHESRDGSGLSPAFVGVVDMHSERGGRARNGEHRPTGRTVELEFLQAEHLAVELPCLVDVPEVNGHRFEPFDRCRHVGPDRTCLLITAR